MLRRVLIQVKVGCEVITGIISQWYCKISTFSESRRFDNDVRMPIQEPIFKYNVKHIYGIGMTMEHLIVILNYGIIDLQMEIQFQFSNFSPPRFNVFISFWRYLTATRNVSLPP